MKHWKTRKLNRVRERNEFKEKEEESFEKLCM
jgi:hypothetical protein